MQIISREDGTREVTGSRGRRENVERRSEAEGKHGDKLDTFFFKKDLNYFSSILAEKDKRVFIWIVLLSVVVYSG